MDLSICIYDSIIKTLNNNKVFHQDFIYIYALFYNNINKICYDCCEKQLFSFFFPFLVYYIKKNKIVKCLWFSSNLIHFILIKIDYFNKINDDIQIIYTEIYDDNESIKLFFDALIDRIIKKNPYIDYNYKSLLILTKILLDYNFIPQSLIILQINKCNEFLDSLYKDKKNYDFINHSPNNYTDYLETITSIITKLTFASYASNIRFFWISAVMRATNYF